MTYDSKFWLAVSFFIFAFCFIKYLLPVLRKLVEKKGKQIFNEIDQYKKNKKVSLNLLKDTEKSYQETKKYYENFLKTAEYEKMEFIKISQDEINKIEKIEIESIERRKSERKQLVIKRMMRDIIFSIEKKSKKELANRNSNLEKRINTNLS